MQNITLPKARVGDVVVGDVHPNRGYVMFEVGSAFRDGQHIWMYVSTDGKTEMSEMWLEHVYKRKDLGR